MDLDPSKGTVSVSFTVPSDLPLTTTTQARVRWANLTGDRYMDLTRGDSQGRPLDEEGRIPVARTLAALDLDDLFNGFKPLRSEEHTSELQSLMRISYAVFCLKKNTPKSSHTQHLH